MTYITGILAICLALVHVLAGKLPFLRVVPRSRLLSIAGGVSVAYVFVHLLPRLSESQEHMEEWSGAGLWGMAERHVYLLSLVGLVVFYGLERMAIASRRAAADEATPGPGMFWIHVGSFAVFNALIGYLLVHREEPGWESLVWFFLAMALHFLVNDHGLREHYKQLYDRTGRWLLAAAAIFGWAVGVATEFHEAAIAALFGLLSGGVILNVLKEELPEERESRFSAFAAGTAMYAALLLLI